MKSSAIKFALSSVVMAAGLAVSTSASAYLPLALTSFEANTDFTFSSASIDNATRVGIKFQALGNTIRLPDLTVTEDGEDSIVPVYRFPVTKTDVNLGGTGGLVTPNSGYAVGSALRVYNKSGDVVLANLGIDFNKKLVLADLIDVKAGTTAKTAPIYAFDFVNTPKLALKGLALTLDASVNHLVFVPTAVTQLSTALNINDVLRAALESLDWGNIVVKVTSKTRKTKTNATPFTLKQVPAQPA